MPNNFATDDILRRSTLAIVMGGGAGTRLFPLTKDRAKPAVPLAGKYRLVDIPISNCINSGVRQVFVLTQYNSASLNRHIARTYKFDQFTRGFVEVLAAQQTPDGERWYQGTADAVRQNLRYFTENNYDYYLILSGDQLYRMDFRLVMAQHIKSGAELTIATLPVNAADATAFGIMKTDSSGRIHEFVEKPKDPAVLENLRMPVETLNELGLAADEPRYQASMGIYVFNRQALIDSLDNNCMDFGKHIIPGALKKYKVHAFNFQGYWEDIGTIRSLSPNTISLTPLHRSLPMPVSCRPQRSMVRRFARRLFPKVASSLMHTWKRQSLACVPSLRPALRCVRSSSWVQIITRALQALTRTSRLPALVATAVLSAPSSTKTCTSETMWSSRLTVSLKIWTVSSSIFATVSSLSPRIQPSPPGHGFDQRRAV
jgi:ADP-glucose pyrophosphorylase